jgi:hypothetical protein
MKMAKDVSSHTEIERRQFSQKYFPGIDPLFVPPPRQWMERTQGYLHTEKDSLILPHMVFNPMMQDYITPGVLELFCKHQYIHQHPQTGRKTTFMKDMSYTVEGVFSRETLSLICTALCLKELRGFTPHKIGLPFSIAGWDLEKMSEKNQFLNLRSIKFTPLKESVALGLTPDINLLNWAPFLRQALKKS